MSAYSELNPMELDSHLSNFLINSWSYSKVQCFSRNEKAFEMSYIYNERGRVSASTVAGQAYHEALEKYFIAKSKKQEIDIIKMQQIAFDKIESITPDRWKISKTCPTIEACRDKANKSVTSFLNNFMSERSIYDIDEVLGTELKMQEWLNVNGVDIPLPCTAVIDLIARKDGKTILIDHKTKASYTDEKDLKFTAAKQAIVYTLAYEEHTGDVVDEVWFIENKSSKNRDKSNQLRSFCIKMDADTRVLYESLLYEPLRAMLQAVSDPDHVYISNDSDNFVDKAELYEFWARTQIAEVSEFDIPENKKGLIEKRMKKIKDSSVSNVSPTIINKFQKNAASFVEYNFNYSDMTNNEKIEHTLRTLNLTTKIEHTFAGYSSSTYLMKVSAGQSIRNIFKYKLDIANALGVSGVRILNNLKEYNGESFVSIESLNKPKDRRMLDWNLKDLSGNKIPLGKNNYEETIYWDLDSHSTPHMLVCGATGSGKSVCLTSTIEYALHTDIDRIVILDPKYEFLFFEDKKIEVYNEIEDIESIMESLVLRMNENIKARKKERIMIVFDEFADAVANATKPKELVPGTRHLEENLRLLLQKGRSIGFRIVAATQRASVKVITGDAKVNFPIQVCFRVPKKVDSNVVIDEDGAELLGGKGDGLIKSPDLLGVERFQGYFKK